MGSATNHVVIHRMPLIGVFSSSFFFGGGGGGGLYLFLLLLKKNYYNYKILNLEILTASDNFNEQMVSF